MEIGAGRTSAPARSRYYYKGAGYNGAGGGLRTRIARSIGHRSAFRKKFEGPISARFGLPARLADRIDGRSGQAPESAKLIRHQVGSGRF